MTELATDTTAPRAEPHAPDAPRPGDLVRRPGHARAAALGRADRRRADRALDRARRPPVPPRREPGRVLLLPVPPDRRLRVQPAAARPAALLPDRADVRAVRRHRLHRPPRPRADGREHGPDVLAAARRCSAASPRSPPRRCSRSARATCTSAASPARTSTSRRSRSRCCRRSGASWTRRACTTRR